MTRWIDIVKAAIEKGREHYELAARTIVERCGHRAAMALAPLIIRWGPETSPDLLRRSARCTQCGRKRATLRHPSWASTIVGFEEFPAERAAPVLVSFV